MLDCPRDVVISLRLGCDVRMAGKSDDVSDSVNYSDVWKDVINYVESTCFNLVEKLSTDVARICIALYKVPWVQVRVHKPLAAHFCNSVGVEIKRTPEDFNDSVVHLSLGSNIQPRKNLRDAIAFLKKKVLVLKMSSPFLTPPQLQTNQPDIVNMAVQILTEMSPTQLKTFTSGIENELLRVRDPDNKHGPRTVDIDISLWGSEVLEYDVVSIDEEGANLNSPNVVSIDKEGTNHSSPNGHVSIDKEGTNHSSPNGHVITRKNVPDPDILRFAHVAVPLAEISPHLRHPTNGSTLSSIARDITGREDYANTFPIVELFR
ncbi:PREDICTED: folic acid synthesis protein FOL1-like [Branchiostoma belcheri]|uniref:7,8-dihydroneopterin aldolase n=1 Tax=Branchiostoma belcheri TaxID=7741 RepID=A0A6P4Y0F4_BRABE|nr:PREDICTED: folic acid synthesis protein FOL1-like [Branchiostoma belcheri]